MVTTLKLTSAAGSLCIYWQVAPLAWSWLTESLATERVRLRRALFLQTKITNLGVWFTSCVDI